MYARAGSGPCALLKVKAGQGAGGLNYHATRHSHKGIVPMQAISAAEEEAAKKKVGGAAALKQLEKLRKEAARTSKEAEKTADDLASRKGEHKVRDITSVHFEEGHRRN